MGPRFESQHDTKHLILRALLLVLPRVSSHVAGATPLTYLAHWSLLLRSSKQHSSPNQPLITSCALIYACAFLLFFFAVHSISLITLAAHSPRSTHSLSSLSFSLGRARPLIWFLLCRLFLLQNILHFNLLPLVYATLLLVLRLQFSRVGGKFSTSGEGGKWKWEKKKEKEGTK